MILAGKFHDYPDVCRARTQQIINETANFVDIVAEKIKKDVLKAVSKDNENSKMVQEVRKIYDENSNPFNDLKTEHNCFKTFNKHGTYVPPESYLLGEREDFVLRGNDQQLYMRPVTAQFVQLRFMLKNFLEMSTVFDETINYVQLFKLDSAITFNFIQGNYGKD